MLIQIKWRRLWVAAIICLLLGCQHEPSDQSKSAHTSQSTAQRLLQLIDRLKGANSVSPSLIEAVMGVPVRFDAKDRQKYAIRSDLSEGWGYSLRHDMSEDAHRLIFEFISKDGRRSDMSPVCAPSFDEYDRKFVEMGFGKKAVYGEQGQIVFYHYSRKEIALAVSTRGESASTMNRECVEIITMDITAGMPAS